MSGVGTRSRHRTRLLLTIGPGDRAGRFVAYERIGEVAGAMTVRRHRVVVAVTETIENALTQHLQDNGLTPVSEVRRVGTSLRLEVEA